MLVITFEPFRAFYNTLGTSKSKKSRFDLLQEANISKDTANRIWYDGNVSLEIVNRLCQTYGLQLHEVITYVEE
ncbi:helix-turn-helix domain-containing protein [Paenibacillus bovis]|uniref:HTH cro/C1-type domain-containing protein n=1 Tax=Paenibacillus bovis TaxID=1616788 RepID=A0A1X9T487_9BACL|nr:hypothetical protein AR543_p0044 [Paenibacillus bovis]